QRPNHPIPSARAAPGDPHDTTPTSRGGRFDRAGSSTAGGCVRYNRTGGLASSPPRNAQVKPKPPSLSSPRRAHDAQFLIVLLTSTEARPRFLACFLRLPSGTFIRHLPAAAAAPIHSFAHPAKALAQ
uniref:Uncharacterized protein n=1 Tax=Aegilops tauschii subsp. strangulata TaxID=200361 RepID=A0A453LFE1_AEGTS